MKRYDINLNNIDTKNKMIHDFALIISKEFNYQGKNYINTFGNYLVFIPLRNNLKYGNNYRIIKTFKYNITTKQVLINK